MSTTKIKVLLDELLALLRAQGESNWIRGVIAARQALDEPDGFAVARSIYGSMNKGVGSFADYNVSRGGADERHAANLQLARTRNQLWLEFDL